MKSPCDICISHLCICNKQNTPKCKSNSSSCVVKSSEMVHLFHNKITPEKKSHFRFSTSSPLQTIKEFSASRNSKFNISTPSRGYRMPTNPFDVEVDSLQTSSFSPSVFATTRRDSEESSSFRWSIEQLAVLKPAEIDETSQQDVCIDMEKEIKAQKAIDAFFSKNHIVPSPWGPSVKCMSFSPHLASTAYPSSNDFQKFSPQSDENDNGPVKEVATQTMLTIPPGIDLMALLGHFCTYQVELKNDSCSSSGSDMDMLSTSSLRRKLFMNDNACPFAPEAEEEENGNDNLRTCFTPDIKTNQQVATPASDHFSSSPITPRNFSLSMNCPRSSLSSPNISPIRATTKSCDSGRAVTSDEDLSASNISGQSFLRSEVGEKCGMLRNKQQSVIMKSVCDCESNSSCSTEVEFCRQSDMINHEEEGIQTSFPDSVSAQRDTGYLTGSMSSVPSMHFQQTSSCGHIRTTPVTELLDGCVITAATHLDACMDEMKSSYDDGDMSFLISGQGDAVDAQALAKEFKSVPWHPDKSSTPTKASS